MILSLSDRYIVKSIVSTENLNTMSAHKFTENNRILGIQCLSIWLIC